MSFNILSRQGATDLVSYSILVNGSELPEEYRIISMEVHKAVNRIPTARLVIADGDAAGQEFPASTGEHFIPGNEIEIQLGYHSEETGIFKGIITKHGIKAGRNGSSVLKLECKDEVYKMSIGRKNRAFTESSDSDIIKSILDEYGLQHEVEDTSEVHEYLAQFDITDWDFINLRAEINGQYVFVTDGEIEVKKLDFSVQPQLTLTYGSGIVDFEAEIDSRTQFNGIKSQSWNSSDQEIIEIDAAGDEGVQPGNLSSNELAGVSGLDHYYLRHTGQISDQELQSWADALISRSRMAKNIGLLSIQGQADLFPGQMITLEGLGDRFNGNALVSGIRHEISGGNWITNIQYGIDFKTFAQRFREDLQPPPASGVISAVSGLQVGIVLQLQDDPKGENRVQIKLPSLGEDFEGVWARLLSLYAGDERGFVFRPEVGDEVLVGFMHDDPRYPVILGALHSSAKPAPLAGSDENHEKVIHTRGGMKIAFDDEKNILEISTPSGNQIKLDEDAAEMHLEDENGNIINMSSEGISLESAGDIVLEATGDIKISGMNVEQSASASFKAEGSAGFEASSSATMVIRGAIVQIN